MPRLSIVIPALNDIASLESGLVSVLQHRPEQCEVLVVLSAPYADPYDLRDEVRFIAAPARASLAQCVGLGFQQAHSPFVHVLGCGVEATEGWTDRPLACFRHDPVAAVAPLVLDLRDGRRVLSAGVEYDPAAGARHRTVCAGEGAGAVEPGDVLGPTLQAGFYRKSAVEQLGGFDAEAGEQAAVDLALRLKSAGLRCVLEPQSTVLAVRERLAPARGFRAGWQAERMFLRHAPAAGWLLACRRHAAAVGGEFLRQLPRPCAFSTLLGRACAWRSMGLLRAHALASADVSAAAPRTAAAGGALRMDGVHQHQPHTETVRHAQRYRTAAE